MENKEVTTKYAAWETEVQFRVFDLYIDAWQFAEQVFTETGRIVAVEPIQFA
jgi:hypothetical protein